MINPVKSFLTHGPLCFGVYNACRLLSALPSVLQFGRGRLSLVATSFYALLLLFGPCRLSEFTLAGPPCSFCNPLPFYSYNYQNRHKIILHKYSLIQHNQAVHNKAHLSWHYKEN